MCDMRSLVLVGILTAALGYWLYEPAPDGYSDPWTFHLTAATLKFMLQYIDIGEQFGFVDRQTFHQAMWLASLNRTPPADDGIKTFDTNFDGVRVRIYEPSNKVNNGPGLIYIHGGGWFLGSIDIYEYVVRHYVKRLGILAVSVEYRLAPKYPFPTAADDCTTAVMHFLKKAETFGVDSTRIAIAGDSAGGNLVAAVLLKLRDTGFTHKPKLGIMIYPVVQALDFNLPSYQERGSDATLSLKLMARFCALYSQGHDRNMAAFLRNDHVSPAAKKVLLPKYVNHDYLPTDSFSSNYNPTSYDNGNATLWQELEPTLTSPYFAPLVANDLRKLPASDLMVITVAHDVLRDEGILFAKRLKKAGNNVVHSHLTYGYHGIYALASDENPIPKSKVQAYEEIFRFVESKI